ncbi:isoamylase early set domain-containing protein [Desulfogranum japonicum]|uniref:isoamylase early set domain-containing protein n=1 Tax=Desulfogranum japonicum TaxID=231447 RepID=UPI000407808F|nr:isoamylase early set domain-containing protein [Desulfogranum japonicum]
MLKKSYSKTGKICRVTFKYVNEEGAESVALAGDFNAWSTDSTPMKKLKDSSFSVTLSLDAGSSYAFRYVIDGQSWVNDDMADSYNPNEFGENNSIVTV